MPHPPSVDLVLMLTTGEEKFVTLRPWSMGQRGELRPRIEALLAKLGATQGGAAALDAGSLAAIYLDAEEELAQLARASLPEDFPWDDLAWEELPVIVQALWRLNIAREDGGGLLGKVTGGLIQLGGAVVNPSPSSTSRTSTGRKSSATKKKGSRSSRAGGAATPRP